MVENMLPSQRELKSESLSELRRFQQPIKTSSSFRRYKKGGPNPLSVKSAAGKKKKRPGPRLREALKAAAAADQAAAIEHAPKDTSGADLWWAQLSC